MKTKEALLEACDRTLELLQSEFGNPEVVSVRGGNAFRYARKNDLLMSYLKCVSALSAANAANILFESGHVAEVIALCRICNECYEDVVFLASPLGDNGKVSERQISHIKEYFQEEFSESGSLAEAQAVRHRTPRSKIQAAIASIPSDISNPHSRRENLNVLYKASSGSVHSAYFQAMDLCGGSAESPRFHVNGISDKNKVDEYALTFNSAINNVSSSIFLLAKRCSQLRLASDLELIQVEFGKDAQLFDEK